MAALVFILKVLFFTLNIVYVKSTCNGETLYVEIESHVVIHCPVDENYLAICWYYEDPHGHPVSCIEGGQKTFQNGYGISDQGEMVIDEFHAEHVGIYFIEVIDTRGNTHNMNITCDVRVSLKSEPIIVDCTSSSHEICKTVEEGKVRTTLTCIAGPAKPAVTISWNSFDGTQQQSVNSNIQNDSTSLFTSTSLFEYNSLHYSLEYFTCNVYGEAVNGMTTVGTFMKGKKNIEVERRAINYVKSGANFTFECPLARGGTLGEWGIRFPNKTYHWLWRKYPGFKGGPCVNDNGCDVQANGDLHITKVTYVNEGYYVCTYTSAASEGVLEIPVEVHVSPEPQQTVIKGCEDKDPCELNVANSGSLECSIFSSRPSIKPEVTVDVTFNPVDVFIFGEEFELVEGALPGTFDTVLRFQYEIPECSDVVRIDCSASDNTHTENITLTTLKLVTATSGCDQGGRPGLHVLLVFFFLLIVGIALFVFKRKYIMYKVRNVNVGKTKDNELRDVEQSYMLTPANEHTARHRHQVEPITDVKNKVIPEDETERLQKIFDDKFQPIYLAITEKEAKYEDFNKMMDSFSVENKVTVPLPYLAEFLKSKSKPMADVLKVLKFVIEHFKNQWVGYFLKMLDDLLQTNQVTATNYITLIGSLVQKRVIELSRYVELTGAFLNNNTASLDIILAELKNLIDRRYCSKEDFSNTFLRYYLGNYITDEDVLKELSAETESFQFVPTYFLQSVYLEFQEKNETKVLGKLSVIFKKVFEQLMGENLSLSIKLKPYLKQPSKQTPASVSEDEKANKTENQNITTNLEVGKERFNESENSPLLNPIKEASVPGEVKEETKGEGNQEAVKNANDETEKPIEVMLA